MGIFDDIDRRFKRPAPITREGPEEGDPCSDPECGGRLEVKTQNPGHPQAYLVLACSECDEQVGDTTP